MPITRFSIASRMEPLSETAWQAWSPDELSARLRGLRLDWYVAGGWALDLWHGHQTRDHDDLEFVVLADQLQAAREALSELEFFATKAGRLIHLPLAASLPDDVWQVWGAEIGARCWRVDLMVERGTKALWVYKRDPGLALPRSAAVRRTSTGIPYLAPPIVLLFKARHARDKDHQDFQAALPRLAAKERADLCAWLMALHPGHPWLGMLQGSQAGSAEPSGGTGLTEP